MARRGEKDEKDEEKRYEKEEEKRQEKSFDEKWRHNPLGAAVWALILIWAGLVLLAANFGLLARFERLSAWNIILAGAGLILLLEVLIRLLVPEYRRPVVGNAILGLLLLAAGLSTVWSWNLVWPLVLIIIGLALVFGYTRRGD
jgi:hypothetical protein